MPTTETRPRRRLRKALLFPLTLALLCAAAAAGLAAEAFFPLLSLWAGALLFTLTLAAGRRAGVQFETFHWTVLAGAYLLLAICLCLAVDSRTFIYIWDYGNYLQLQYTAEAAFAAGPLQGLWHLVSSFTQDYTSFICLFTEFPFCLTGHTGDSYVKSMAVSVLPSLLAALGAVVCKAGQMLQVQNQQGFFLMGLTLSACWPFVRLAAALGQPDWLGLVFALIILVLTLDYRFDAPDPARWVGLFFATMALMLTRRWYLYFILAYYAVYAVTVAAGAAGLARHRQDRRAADRIRGLVTFGAGSVAAAIVLFWPVLQHLISYSYAQRFAAYNVGGLGLELYSQAWRLGPLYLPLALAGVVWAFRHGAGAMAGQALGTLALSLVLFTRVQNMGSHQTLLLAPGYILLFLLGAAPLADSLARRAPLKIGLWLFTLAFSLSARLSPLTTVALPEPLVTALGRLPVFAQFVQLDTLTYDREDLAQIQALSAWVDSHCAAGEYAYMIPHSMTYCPDTFKNASLPDRPLEDKLAFGFGILGTQSFPTQLFEAKYVITADPFPWCYEVSSVAAKLNDQFLALQDAYFVPETVFDMGNGTRFTIYRRITPATRAEAEAYLAAFAAEDAQYPDLFSQVIQAWLAQKGL